MLFSLENSVFTEFFGIIRNPVASVWYYHMPFFSNVETQVIYNAAGCSTNSRFVIIVKVGVGKAAYYTAFY